MDGESVAQKRNVNSNRELLEWNNYTGRGWEEYEQERMKKGVASAGVALNRCLYKHPRQHVQQARSCISS